MGDGLPGHPRRTAGFCRQGEREKDHLPRVLGAAQDHERQCQVTVGPGARRGDDARVARPGLAVDRQRASRCRRSQTARDHGERPGAPRLGFRGYPSSGTPEELYGLHGQIQQRDVRAGAHKSQPVYTGSERPGPELRREEACGVRKNAPAAADSGQAAEPDTRLRPCDRRGAHAAVRRRHGAL